jgi:tetratricopeptide (TPR) repeat protein
VEALAVLAADGSRPPGALLSTLVRKELILPHDVIGDTFRFRHVLICDAAYERIPKELRSELYERFADWLEPRGPEFEEIVGYHLEQSYRSVEALEPVGERGRALAERAAERLAASGLRAAGRGDTQATVNLLERAAALLPSDDPRRLVLLPPLGRALREEGETDRAETILAGAVELGRATGERAVGADAAVALIELRFHRTVQTGVAREDVWRELDAAIPVFEELGDEAGLARALCLAGKLRFWKGQSAPALEEFERSVRHARSAGDRTDEIESLRYMLITMHRGPMPVDEALARSVELRDLGPTDHRLGIGWRTTCAQLEAMRGNFDVARELLAEARALAEELGGTFVHHKHVAPAAGEVELLAGDPGAAVRELRLTCEAFERDRELGYLASLAPRLGEALLAIGDEEEAFEVVERWRADRLTTPEDADAQVGWRRVRAKVLARRGEFEEAERLAREGVDMVSETDMLPLRADAQADLSEVLRLAGKPEEAEAARLEALRLYEQKGNVVRAAALATDSSVSAP